MFRGLVTLVGLLALVLIVLAAVGFFGPTSPSPQSPSPSGPLARSATPAAGTSARSLTLTLTEQQLTDAARASMPLSVSGVTVTDPSVRLEPGRATLTATGHAMFLSGPIVVVATPVVADGEANARIESATFAGFGLSDSMKQDIADTFTRTLRSSIPAGVRVTSITVNSGTLVVVAVPA